ncbi:MAG: peptidase T [Ruminococcaceae bacterium]|nr:peptidase T [Oscillospiraceae bacterium]
MDITNRFLKYVSFPTMSDEGSDTVPSSDKQLVLSRYLADELISLGLSDVELDQKGYLYTTLPANTDKVKVTLGLIAHVDTSDACADYPINAKIVEYKGGDVCLNSEKEIYLTENDYPNLKNYVGDHLIVTDGTTLLGADDKAGVCAIVSAVERIIKSNAPHGCIKICFTPDEEIGRGADHFDVQKFAADYAYTVDGGALGELEYENFNAAAAKAVFNGISIHPGSAKDKMKNAQLVAMEFNSMLPPDQIPAKTEGYEGFFHLCDMNGDCENAELIYIIRDHDKEKFIEKKRLFTDCANAINEKYGAETCIATVRDSYYNMKEIIDDHMYTVDRAKKAMLEVGVTPVVCPIRGGTDGARLSFMGLPCPNICTGGENFHSRFEFLSVESLNKVVDIVERLILNTAIEEN